jgi:rhodanese-related sulfurtransferase
MKRLRGMQYALVLVSLMGLNLTAWAHIDITPQEAKNLIDTNDNLMVVDVREEESEYCDENPTPPVPPGHIPGALNYPWSSGVLQERYGELPIDGKILIVCRSGSRSNQAAGFLDSKGYLYIYDMTGGMSDWQWETVGCIDSDSDGLNDDLDPDDDNDGICDPGESDLSCTGSDNCQLVFNPVQSDTYPPQGNGIGDACDCEANFNCDEDVDAEDATTFLQDFGRSIFCGASFLCISCSNETPCRADFDCSRNVDALDVIKFLEDFGRSQFNNPCPACVVGDWCVYP